MKYEKGDKIAIYKIDDKYYIDGVEISKEKIHKLMEQLMDYYSQKDVNCCIEFHDIYEED